MVLISKKMKSELLIKMTASVAVFSASTVGLGSMAVVNQGDSATSNVVVMSSESVISGLEYAIDNTQDNIDYASLMQNISTNSKKRDSNTARKKTVTTNDNNTQKNKQCLKKCVAKTDTYVNIRKTASTTGEVVGMMANGSVADVLSVSGEWVLVRSDDVTGYVNKQYLDMNVTSTNNTHHNKKMISVKTSLLNIREKESENSKILARLKKGDKALLIKEQGDWLQIKTGNIIGFVSKEYVDICNDYKGAKSVKSDINAIKTESSKEDSTKADNTYKKTSDISKKVVNKQPSVKKATINKTATTNKSKTSVKSTESNNSYGITDEEFKYLACIIFCEAGVEPYSGKIGVANVIFNRVNSKNYPGSIIGVIKQKGQFSPYRTGKLAKELKKYDNGKYSSDSYRKECVRALKDALNGKNTVGSRCSFNGVRAESKKGHKNSLVIGGHMFW